MLLLIEDVAGSSSHPLIGTSEIGWILKPESMLVDLDSMFVELDAPDIFCY